MAQDKTFYLGKNGLEYPEYDDAVRYGGGAVGKRTVYADRYDHFDPIDESKVPVEQDVMTPTETTARGDMQVSESQGVLTGSTEPMTTGFDIDESDPESLTEDQLRIFLKQNNVKGWNLMGRERMVLEAKVVINNKILANQNNV